jgi:hypothetical protein
MRVLRWHHERDGSRNYSVFIPRSLFEKLVQLRVRSGPAQLNFGGVLAAALEDAASEISTLLDHLAAGEIVAEELRDRRMTAPVAGITSGDEREFTAVAAAA